MILTGRPTISTTLSGRSTVSTVFTGRQQITTKSFLLINGIDFLLINGTDKLIISEVIGTPFTGRIIPT